MVRLTFSGTSSDSRLVAQIVWRFFGGLSVAVPSCGQQRKTTIEKTQGFLPSSTVVSSPSVVSVGLSLLAHRSFVPRTIVCSDTFILAGLV